MAIKVLQANLNNSKTAHDLVTMTANRKKIDVCIISEPNAAISRRKISQNWIATAEGTVALWWTQKNRDTQIMESKAKSHIAWLKLSDGTSIIGCYCPPNETANEYTARLEEISNTIEQMGTTNVILAGDFNAKSEAWGSTTSNPRGRRLLELIEQHNLTILNTGNAPTFERREQESSIDVTAGGSSITQRIGGWQILTEETQSDHNYITFNVEQQVTARTRTRRERLNIRDINSTKFCEKLQQQIVDPQEPQEMTKLTALIKEAHSEARVTLPTPVKDNNPVYWWNEEIEEQRKQCIKLKRMMARERTRIQKGKTNRRDLEKLAEEAKQAKKRYRKKIHEAKEKSWRELCETVEMDPFGKPYKIVMNKLGNPLPPITEEMAPIIVRTLFPRQEATMPPRLQVEQTDIQDITDDEIETLCENSPRKKAPGPDGIPAELIKALIKNSPEIFRTFINQCLQKGEFPNEGKIATLTLLAKPGKPPGDPSAYRPICLINTLAKALESVINMRLTAELEGNDRLSHNQYGFRKKRSTISAVQVVLDAAEEELRKTKYTRQLCLLVLLDVKNAFNSLSWGVVNKALEEKQVSPYLRNIIGDYLSNRAVIENGTRYEMTAGVPQGSVLGPTLWNVAYDSVLNLTLPEEVRSVAYADDLAILIKTTTMEQLETKTNIALERVADWMKNNKLELAPQKSEGLLLVGKKRCRDPEIYLNNQRINIVNKARYLGVILDKRLTFTKHIEQATVKARKVANNVARMLPRTSRVTEQKRRIIATVAESVVMYAAPVWAEKALELKTNRTKLDAAQRPSAIRVARAHRTVSTEALMVLARTVPWTLLADERKRQYENRINQTGQCLHEIKKETITKWQERWQNNQTGKAQWTKYLIPNLDEWINRKHGDITYFLAQMLSGHGKFQTYLKRIQKTNTDICPYCENSAVDDVIHTLYECDAYEDKRTTLKPKGGEDRRETMRKRVQDMLNSSEEWEQTAKEVEEIMRHKSKLEKKMLERQPPPDDVTDQGAAENVSDEDTLT